MFREMHHMDHNLRAMDRAEKIAERRKQSLAVSSTPSGRTRMTRWLLAVAASVTGQQAAGRA